jgi:hypothetical protein
MWFFTATDPTLTFGGWEGEGKMEMYAQLPPETYPSTLLVDPEVPWEVAKAGAADLGLTAPFIVKPDIGMKSLMFRQIWNDAQWIEYHKNSPGKYLTQTFIDYPMEISVFYIRRPGQDQGRITGMISKEYMTVFGDGKSTLLELIERHSKARHYLAWMKKRHREHLSDILSPGQSFQLTIEGSRNRGAQLHNISHQIDPELCAFFDRLSHFKGHLYYGRYDIKCDSIDSLKRGSRFSILEFNGTGAGPSHIFHCDNTLLQAYGIVIEHINEMSLIARENHRRGYKYWTFRRGIVHLREANAYFKKLYRAEKIV